MDNDITREPNAYWLSGNPVKDTLWAWLKAQPQTDTVELSDTNIKALAGTQIELVPAPGADKYLEFIGATLILDRTTTRDDAAADGNMIIRYTNGSGVVVSEDIEGDAFIDAVADEITCAIPKKDAIVAASACINKALVLDNDGAEYTGGSGTMTVKITYLIRDAGLA